MNRSKKLTSKINRTGQGLEIGPLCWPILAKHEADVYYVDHTSRDNLLKIYKNDPGIKPEEIVEVDFPLNGKSLSETVGISKYDFILASHVIEHVPDVVEWLNDMMSVLKVGGILSLAIPDKRFTFDIDRYESTIADIVGTYIDKNTRPSTATVIDFATNYRDKVDPHQAWAGQSYISENAGPHKYSLREAVDLAIINKKGEKYVDTHTFTFTPASFIAILKGLADLKLTQFELVEMYDTEKSEYEFFVSLQKTPAGKSSKHLKKFEKRIGVWHPRSADILNNELQNTLVDLSNKNQELQSNIDELRSSMSWKITKPARYLKRSLSKLR